MDHRGDADEEWVIERELELLEPAVRRSASRLDALLDPDFFEFGASGRRWDRQATIDMLVAASPDQQPIATSDVAATRLAEDLIQVIYLSESGPRRAWRSSLWRRSNGQWRVYFHQATVIPS